MLYTKNVHMMSQFSMTFMWNPVLPLWCLETFTTKITGLWLELMTINRKFINQHKTITCTSFLYNIYSCYDIAERLLKLALNTNPGIDINFWTNVSHRLNFTCPKVKTTFEVLLVSNMHDQLNLLPELVHFMFGVTTVVSR